MNYGDDPTIVHSNRPSQDELLAIQKAIEEFILKGGSIEIVPSQETGFKLLKPAYCWNKLTD